MVDPSSTPSILEITSKIMIAAVITFFIVIIFIFLLHLYARCLWSAAPEDPDIVSWRRQLARQNQPSGAAQRRQRGLDRPTLRSLPVVVYNPKEFKEGLECAVCLSELVQGEKARVLPICKHGFHLDCIDMWFKSHSTCPICRTVVVSEGSDEGVSGSDSVPVEPQPGEGDVNSSGYSSESPVFPTNVLFWGDEVQVRTSVEVVVPSASSSGKPQESLVIDIPMSSVGPSTTTRMGAEDEAQSPVMARIKSLKRLLSRGKKVSPSPCSSSSGFGDDEQV